MQILISINHRHKIFLNQATNGTNLMPFNLSEAQLISGQNLLTKGFYPWRDYRIELIDAYRSMMINKRFKARRLTIKYTNNNGVNFTHFSQLLNKNVLRRLNRQALAKPSDKRIRHAFALEHENRQQLKQSLRQTQAPRQ
tara:strand:+ start:88 stop:507 length:420 start_codon:yes stop_codon:yes gene_type:complete